MTKKSIYLLLTVTLLALGLAAIFTSVFKIKRPNVILIMIDTLRADHLGVYGYRRDTSPSMDQFARDNIMAKRAIAVAPWTPPSVASILSGLAVARHGHSPDLVESRSRKLGQTLREDIDLLPEILQRNGYKTAGVSSNPWITKEFKFDQGFDSFFYQRRANTGIVMTAAREFVEQLKTEQFFLYLHILDPHGPRTPSAEYAAMFQGRVEGTFPYDEEMQKDVNLYDAEIRSVDDHLSQFFSFLRNSGIYDDAVVLIVSDHGEQLKEHGEAGHGKMLHIEEVHVPFLFKCKSKQQVIDGVVSNLDVTPSILDCIDVDVDTVFDGVSVLDAKALEQRVGAFSSVKRVFMQEAFTSSEGLRIINHKGRVKNLAKDWELKGIYDLEKDPLEVSPINNTELQSELNGYLNSLKSKQTPEKKVEAKTKEVSAESLEQLESLGYIND